MGAAEDIENGWFSMKENDFIFWQLFYISVMLLFIELANKITANKELECWYVGLLTLNNNQN